MDPSALESVSRSLESSLDYWGRWLLGATCVVAIGLVLEYWSPLSDFIAELARPMARLRWERVRDIFGAILITIGVVGEFGFTYKASRVEGQLRGNNHKIETLLNQEAGDAKISAEGAAA